MKVSVILSVIFLSAFFFSCEDALQFLDDNSNSNSGNEIIISEGQWRITNYTDRAKNETSDYNGYEFNFEDNGTIVVLNNLNNYTGTWRTGNDDSKDKFIIAFNAPERLREISDDWEIVEQTDSKLELYHKSGGDGHESFLTFEK